MKCEHKNLTKSDEKDLYFCSDCATNFKTEIIVEVQ